MRHTLKVTDAKTNDAGTVTLTFGCTCGAYDNDQTVGRDRPEAERRARQHVVTHSRICRGGSAITL